MSETDNIIVDTTTRIFQDLCDPQTVNNAGDDSWRAPLWNALEESGLTVAWVPDTLGGAGIELADAFEILRVSGQFAVPVPLGETLLAGWLLGAAEMEVPMGAMTVAPTREADTIQLGADGTLSGRARGIPFGREVEHIAVMAARDGDAAVALVARADCAIVEGSSLASDPKDDVVFDGVVPVATQAAPDGLDRDRLMSMGAAVRAVQMAGALEALLDISVEYSKERVAFERPISKFQAVQHNLARLADEVAAAVAVSGSAADALQNRGFDEHSLLEVAAAKIRVGEAAGEGAAIAHQAHGAIGFTKEHILHRYTQRLWSWRDEFGSEAVWAVRLGRLIARKGPEELWPTLTVG